MISIIVCSRYSILSEQFVQNIDDTVNLEYEIIHIDNSKNKYSIFSAYNEGISRSKYPFLCFVHEDVLFHSKQWGEKVIKHLQVPDTGIIGLAGGDAMVRVPSDWWTLNESIHITHRNENDTTSYLFRPEGYDKSSRSVVLLDGVFMCMNRSIFDKIKFDETIGGFHCYDFDISIQSILSGFFNYVVYDIELEHFSKGKRDANYYRKLTGVFQKWYSHLPLFERSIRQNEQSNLLSKLENQRLKKLIKNLIRSGFNSNETAEIISDLTRKTSSKISIFLLHFIKIRIYLIRIISIIRFGEPKKRLITGISVSGLQPEVSIAICAYNGEQFLVEQIESILNQDYQHITEIVCVDDNSSDNTWEILKEFSAKNPIFKIFRNESNLGYVKNFEKALMLTTKPFVALSDQDDIWYKSKISKLVNAIGTNFMVYSDSEYIDSKGNSVGNKLSDNRNLATCTSCLNFALFNGISGHNMLINRDLLKFAVPFNEQIPHDFWLGFHASQHGEIPVVNEALVGYRQHGNNIIGGIGHIGGRTDSDLERIQNSQIRVGIFAKNTASHLQKEKLIFEQLAKSYTDKSVSMRLKRVKLFWENNDALLLFKKRTKIRNLLYCIKVFWKYQ